MPTCLPLVLRRRRSCGGGRFRPNGRFRANAHHKLIEAWLLALRTTCGDTAKLAVFERTRVRSVPRGLLDRPHANDPLLAAESLGDPAALRRSRVTLDRTGARRLDTGGSDHLDREVLDVAVRFAARIPVRPVRLIAQGCGLSRSEVGRMAAEGRVVSAVRLDARLTDGFTFTLKR
ncbi:DUF1062 domain-containing protein [Streptomyces parvulus]|uniref:DUF1062 domain-containing protein n=1 Tax=Streptomyces parvulus TaxID=146923 RepID=UPI0036B3CAFB